MKTKADLTRTRGRVRGRRRAPRPPGGKVLQRLFSYLGQRDPALNNDIVATVAVPKAARPNYALTKQALKAKPPTAAAVTRVARRTPAARPYAVSITRAAAKLPRPRRKRAGSRRTARAAVSPMATPPGAPGVWQAIGPTRIKNGQTYGTNRVDVSGRVSSLATGATWSPCTDHLPSLAIGAVTFDPTAPNRAYAGSGEGNFYSNLGAGVYKS